MDCEHGIPTTTDLADASVCISGGTCPWCYGNKVREELVSLEADNQELRRRLFTKARVILRHETAYTDEELLKMFSPYLLKGETKGLSIRECRLLETIADANAQLKEAQTEIEGLEENILDMTNN